MSEYLVHHGILGQKWGVRRYQNPDGTLTNAGRKRLRNETDSEINIAKKSLSIAEKDYEKKKMARDEADSKLYRYWDEVNTPGNNTFSSETESNLVNDYREKDREFSYASGNYEGVKSYLKGLSGEPLDEHDFSKGEIGRKYIYSLLNDPEYSDVFWDKNGKLKGGH